MKSIHRMPFGAATRPVTRPLRAADCAVHWQLGDGSHWRDLGEKTVANMPCPSGDTLYRSAHLSSGQLKNASMPPWSVAWLLEPNPERNAP